MAFSFRHIGGAFGVLITGYLFDVTGSYTLPFAIAGFLLLPAATAAIMVREKKYSVRYQATAPASKLETSTSGA